MRKILQVWLAMNVIDKIIFLAVLPLLAAQYRNDNNNQNGNSYLEPCFRHRKDDKQGSKPDVQRKRNVHNATVAKTL